MLSFGTNFVVMSSDVYTQAKAYDLIKRALESKALKSSDGILSEEEIKAILNAESIFIKEEEHKQYFLRKCRCNEEGSTFFGVYGLGCLILGKYCWYSPQPVSEPVRFFGQVAGGINICFGLYCMLGMAIHHGALEYLFSRLQLLKLKMTGYSRILKSDLCQGYWGVDDPDKFYPFLIGAQYDDGLSNQLKHLYPALYDSKNQSINVLKIDFNKIREMQAFLADVKHEGNVHCKRNTKFATEVCSLLGMVVN